MAKRRKGRRITREKRTVAAMIAIFCRRQHGGEQQLCGSCNELLQYALWRLDRCPFGHSKPTCARCTVHCYKPEMRERIKQVMRVAGPAMLLRHPVLALLHKWDSRRYSGRISSGDALPACGPIDHSPVGSSATEAGGTESR